MAERSPAEFADARRAASGAVQPIGSNPIAMTRRPVSADLLMIVGKSAQVALGAIRGSSAGARTVRPPRPLAVRNSVAGTRSVLLCPVHADGHDGLRCDWATSPRPVAARAARMGYAAHAAMRRFRPASRRSGPARR